MSEVMQKEAIPSEDYPNLPLAGEMAEALGTVVQSYMENHGANPNTVMHATVLFFASGFGGWLRYNDDAMKSLLEAFAAHVCAEIVIQKQEAMQDLMAEEADGPEEPHPV